MSGTPAPVIERVPAKILTGTAKDAQRLKRNVAMKHR